MMNPQSIRRTADLERLQGLVASTAGRIHVVEDGRRSARYVLDLRFTTAGSSGYPLVKQPTTRLIVDLSTRYPFQAPVATIVSPIFHPNVFGSGLVCLGTKWLPGEGIDLFILRIVRLLTFDPLLVNLQSAANAQALHWYVQARKAYPGSFPSDRVELAGSGAKPANGASSGIQWGDSGERVVVPCPRCNTKLRLPQGRTGQAKCPRCTHLFEART
ncbi:MAG: ubiquitin-conjugating enzyme E2 [Burkholderiales bacterium]